MNFPIGFLFDKCGHCYNVSCLMFLVQKMSSGNAAAAKMITF